MYHFYHPAVAFAMQHYLPRKLVSRPYVHNPAPIPISQDSTFSKLQFNLRTVKREEEEERETRRERERVGDGGPSEEREKKTHQRGWRKEALRDIEFKRERERERERERMVLSLHPVKTHVEMKIRQPDETASAGCAEFRLLRVEAVVWPRLPESMRCRVAATLCLCRVQAAPRRRREKERGEAGVELSPGGNESKRLRVQALPSPGCANISNGKLENVKLQTLQSGVDNACCES